MTDVGRNEPIEQVGILTAHYEELLQRQKELLEAANRAPKTCEDDETAKRLTDFVGQMAAFISVALKAHKVEKEPYLEGGRTVDRFFADLKGPLLVFKQTFERLIGDWQFRKQEAARLAAEAEAERLAALAETEEDLEAAIDQEAIAKARPLERSRIHGDLATGSLRIEYEYEIIDLTKIPRQFLVLDALAVRRHMAARPQDGEPVPVPGLRFTPVHKARIRA